MPEPLDLKNLTRRELAAALVERGFERYRGEQLFRWIHGRDEADFARMSDVNRALRDELSATAMVLRLRVDAEQVSVDGTRKLRLVTGDGRFIESVLIPDGDAGSDDDDDSEDGEEHDDEVPVRAGGRGAYEGGRPRRAPPGGNAPRPKLTQCISSQVGCALDCAFCATATLGFGRNLTAGEIVDQVYRARAIVAALPVGDPTQRAGATRITNLVFMGMGEPLHNFAELERALAILTDEMGLGLSPRRITVSTAGLVPAIDRLGQLPQRPNLAVSLNATTDEVRDRIMPINRRWNLAALLGAVRRFPVERRRRVTFEYVLLADVNDAPADARRLAELLQNIPAKINVIPWNAHPGSDFRRPGDDAIRAFTDEVRQHGLAVYVRRTRGGDIDAACGQLAARAAHAPPPIELRPPIAR